MVPGSVVTIRFRNITALQKAHFRPISSASSDCLPGKHSTQPCTRQIAAASLPTSSAITSDQVEIVLELHQEQALAFEYASGIRAVLVIAEDPYVLQH